MTKNVLTFDVLDGMCSTIQKDTQHEKCSFLEFFVFRTIHLSYIFFGLIDLECCVLIPSFHNPEQNERRIQTKMVKRKTLACLVFMFSVSVHSSFWLYFLCATTSKQTKFFNNKSIDICNCNAELFMFYSPIQIIYAKLYIIYEIK